MFSSAIKVAEMVPAAKPLDIIIKGGPVAVHLLVEKVNYEPE